MQCFFFDALGVEYLAFIAAKCEEYELVSEILVGRCELPSITEKIKNSYNTLRMEIGEKSMTLMR